MGNIPKRFYSDLDNKPFKTCKVCSAVITEGKEPYIIEKAYKKTEEGEDLTLFELAMCMNCAQEQSNKMSEESRAFIQNTMMNESIMQKRAALFDADWENSWNTKCLHSEKEVLVNEEYHIVGHFLGENILPGQPPFVMGQALINYLQENISVETKEEWDNFGRTYLGPSDPKLKALLEDYQYTLV
ncbi:MAG: hypothetical protein ACPGU5_03150 [Lishizhenia sp.]